MRIVGSVNLQTGVAVACFVLVSLLSANAERHRTSSSAHSSSANTSHRHSSADYSPLNAASAQQKAQQTELKKLEGQSARMAATPERSSKSSALRIKPLKLDGPSKSGGSNNFAVKSQKIHATSAPRSSRSTRSIGTRHNGR